jgi:tripartite-type tricarboxylate transporter receptor subunit TctC
MGQTPYVARSLFVAFASGTGQRRRVGAKRPLRLIVPFPTGGTADLLGRLIAPALGNALGQQIVVDNRAGAGGVIAMEAAAHAQPDGYTLGLPSLTAHAGNATLNTAFLMIRSATSCRSHSPVSRRWCSWSIRRILRCRSRT